MNLLKNPNFDQGHHHQDNIPEIVVPNDWRIYWIDNAVFPGSASKSFRPESVVWNIIHAPEHEKSLFFLEGKYCWKVFKAHAPVYFAVTQHVKGLTPGGKYRFTAQVFPDIVQGYKNGKKIWAGDPWSAESRAGWSDPDTPWPQAQDGDVEWAPWFNINNGNFAFGQYNEVWVEFEAPASGEVRVWLECKAKWGFENNWFMDAFSLVQIGGTPTPQPPEPPEPPPPPEPGPGPNRGAPRVDYERLYFLLPTDLDAALVQAAVRVAQQMEATVGFSPDDAGIGDLSERRVICVLPERVLTGLGQAWYNEHYPGVKFSAVRSVRDAADLEAQLRAVFFA